uniref:Uncharacterized protein n=1 Tax=Anguilla anguilla TaxID=7936 RepID=A0A0E9WZK6_ANGAN
MFRKGLTFNVISHNLIPILNYPYICASTVQTSLPTMKV